MSTSASDKVRPTIPDGFDLPFYYGAFINLGVDYLVAKDEAEKLLSECGPGGQLSVAEFGGQACLSFNYQVYFAQFAHGAGVTQEIELNVVAYPTAAANRVPKLTYEEYAAGEDQTGNLGFCRYRVACDSPPAIDAGEQLFGEPKFRADFAVTLPVPNGAPVEETTGWKVVWYDRWKVECGEVEKNERGGTFTLKHFSFTADLRNIPAKAVSAAPFTEFGTRKAEGVDRALAAPLNVFQPYQWYDLKGQENKVVLKLGAEPDPKVKTSGPDPKIKAFVETIQKVAPAGAWLYQSPPVAVQNRPYFLPRASS